jgi:hypothetical protein
MDRQHSHDQDDLSDIERRLACWRPTADFLDTDAMLFAAGLAAGRQSRSRLWPTLCALLIVPMAALGAWAISERSERLTLSHELASHRRLAGASSYASNTRQAPLEYLPSPNDYFHLRRRVEEDARNSLASVTFTRPEAVGQQSPSSAILRAGQWSDLVQ